MTTMPPSNDDKYRLPDTVYPEHYDIKITTDLKKFTFAGEVSILVKAKKTASKLVFNANESVNIMDILVIRNSTAVKSSFTREGDRVTVPIPNDIAEGSTATLYVKYDGRLQDLQAGYYRSSVLLGEEKIFYALTQFEAIDARGAFPCWDEPSYKSTYSITMKSRADTVNLSNMPVISEGPCPAPQEEDADNWKETKFEKSPLMSTYLVAWANGPFVFKEASYKSTRGKVIPLRVYTTPDLKEQTDFPLNSVVAKVMPVYETYFDVPYPLPKLDVLAVHDFDASAMENWGLITGRTNAVLLDKSDASIAETQRVANTVSHECSHLWFGDIVTMAWWDDLWLNEGFATLMGEVVIKNKIFKEWNAYAEFITNQLGPALALDSKRSSHPIRDKIEDASEADQKFDALTYKKAASVLRMLSTIVGEEVFQKGVSKYLKANLYKNTEAKDLWKGISEAVKEAGKTLDVDAFMENWTAKVGFPIVRVTETPAGIKVRQDRFLETGDVKPNENDTIWQIPLNLYAVGTSGGPITYPILNQREDSFKLDTSKPFKVNAGTTGVYRVLYSPERFLKILEEAQKKGSALKEEDRMGLIADAMAFGRSGDGKTSTALDLLHASQSEEQYVVWGEIANQLSGLISVWWEQPLAIRDRLDAFRRLLFSPLVEKYGYDPKEKETDDDKQLRTVAIAEAAAANDPKVVAELKSRFERSVNGDNSGVPADIRQSVYTTAIRYGGRKEYEAVKKVYLNSTTTPAAKLASLMALTASTDAEIIQESLKFGLSSDVKGQDAPAFFGGSASWGSSRRATVEFVLENYPQIRDNRPDISKQRLISLVFSRLSTMEDWKRISDFFEKEDQKGFGLVLKQTLDGIEVNSGWVTRGAADVAEWLKKIPS